jgi:hypothetical protein
MTSGRRLLVPLILAALVCAAATTGTAGTSSTSACRAGTKRAVIGGKVKCLKAGQSCSARYQAAYRKYGFTCVSGHLRKRKTTPAPQPPPPPAPPPQPPAPLWQPGHYHGLDSQNEVVDFDADAQAATNISTGQINQGCTPGGVTISGGGFDRDSTTIAGDGTFIVDFDFQGKFSDGTPYSGHLNFTGHLSGATASGTLSATLNFTSAGTGYRCGSGVQNWTAARTG